MPGVLSSISCAVQVYLSNMPLADLAASVSAETDKLCSSTAEEDFNPEDEPEGVSTAASLSAPMAVDSQGMSDKALEQQTLPRLDQQGVQDAPKLQGGAAESDRADLGGEGGTNTLVVRKGQQLQELVVSGIISQGQLRDEVENLVSMLLSP